MIIGGKKGAIILPNLIELYDNKDLIGGNIVNNVDEDKGSKIKLANHFIIPRIVSMLFQARNYHAACLGNSHNIMVAGGETEQGLTNTCE